MEVSKLRSGKTRSLSTPKEITMTDCTDKSDHTGVAGVTCDTSKVNPTNTAMKSEVTLDLIYHKMLTLSSKEDTSKVYEALNSKIDDIKLTLDNNSKTTESLLNKLSEQQKTITDLDSKVSSVQHELDKKESRISKLERKIEEMELETRKLNLILHGVPEGERDVRAIIDELFTDLNTGLTTKDCGNIYRLGQKQEGPQKVRPILVQLDKVRHKGAIFKNIKLLQNKPRWRHVSIARRKADLRVVLNLAKEKGVSARWSGQGIVIQNKRYTHSDIHQLPQDLHIENAKTIQTNEGIVFQGEHSYLSNFYRAPIELSSGKFNNVEQAFVHARAVHCQAPAIADEILRTPDPYLCKQLGKQIKTTPEWDMVKLGLLEKLIRAKFTQHPALADRLMKTENSKLFEGTRDRFYGVGIPISQHQSIGPNNPGQNKLGEILEKVRADLQH